jgi:hypothetical protein
MDHRRIQQQGDDTTMEPIRIPLVPPIAGEGGRHAAVILLYEPQSQAPAARVTTGDTRRVTRFAKANGTSCNLGLSFHR